MSELKDKTIKGIMWSGIEALSYKCIQFIITIIMARLLTPDDYGLVGMLAIFISIAQSLIDSGFSQALIRKKNRTRVDESTIFFFNIIVSTIMYIVLFISAPYISKFYNLPELCLLTRVLTLSMLINSLGIIQRTLYTININFKTQAKASLTSAAISGIAGILSAYHGFGVWALIVQQITSAIIYNILLWLNSTWRPILTFSWESFKDMFAFGSKLLISGLINNIYNNIYSVIIGKIYNASSLGLYSRACQFAEFPALTLNGIIQRVTYPVLCNLQNETQRMQDIYRKLLKLSAFILFPIMTGLAATAYPTIKLILGEEWMFSATLLQIICFSYMLLPIHSMNINMLEVTGRSDLFLKLEIIKKIYGVIIICITIPLGLKALCYGGIVGSFIGLIINTYYTGKLINLGFIKQMKDLLPTFILSLTMFILVLSIVTFIGNNILSLISGIIIGAVYFISLSYLFKFEELKELWHIVRQRI